MFNDSCDNGLFNIGGSIGGIGISVLLWSKKLLIVFINYNYKTKIFY